MDQTELRQYLDRFISTLKADEESLLKARLQGLVSVFPFNEYEYILMFLQDRGVLAFEDYERLREQYVAANRYLNLFGLAPRIFGQVWGEQHLMDLDQRFKKPNTSLNGEFEGQYDLYIDGFKVEVKAARATNTKKRGDPVSKALRSDSQEPFWMNFQQIKLGIVDVFVFIGVWVDIIRYWVLSDEQVKTSPHCSYQHRGGIEYQIGVKHTNISDFESFEVEAGQIGNRILSLTKGKERSGQENKEESTQGGA